VSSVNQGLYFLLTVSCVVWRNWRHYVSVLIAYVLQAATETFSKLSDITAEPITSVDTENQWTCMIHVIEGVMKRVVKCCIMDVTDQVNEC